MSWLDSRTSVLLLAVLVAFATVPATQLSVEAADSELDDSLSSTSNSVEGDSVAQETPKNETTTPETITPEDEADGDHAVGPLAFPDRPDSLDATGALRYVAAYEEVRKHNEILTETTDVSITAISVGCSPTSLDEQADGFAVEVTCGFSYEFGEDGTSTGIADGVPYTARYLVGEDATELRGLWWAIGSGEALPLPEPDRPTTMTDVAVAAYAANHEEVRKHNTLLNETNATVTRANVLCEPDRIEERDDDFVVDLSCGFSYDFRAQDGTVGVADGVPYTARYRIGETTTELVRVETVGGNATTTSVAG